MSDESKISHTAIRTYAKDLDAERKRQNKPVNTELIARDVIDPKEEVRQSKRKDDAVFVDDNNESYTSEHLAKAPSPVKRIVHKEQEVPKPATKIPAFHEINKHEALIKNEPKEDKEVPKFKVNVKKYKDDEPKKTNIGYDATVITDTKANSFDLVPSIVDSLKAWFKSILKKRRVKAQPKYTLPKTSRRKDVIQKATSKTGAVFSESNDTLKDKIKLRQQKDRLKQDSKPAWSPYTESGFVLLEEPSELTNVEIEYKRSGEEVVDQLISKNIEVENDQDFLDEERWGASNYEEPSEEEVVAEPEQETKVSENSQESDIDTKENNQINSEAEQVLDPVENITKEKKVSKKEPASPKVKTSTSLLNFETNTISLSILMIVVLMLIMVFYVKTYSSSHEQKLETTSEYSAVATVLENSELLSIVITRDDINNIPNLLSEAIVNVPFGTVELPIVSEANKELGPSYLFSILGFEITPSLRQSLITTRFISFNQSKPALLIKFIDEDTVRGGMLNWEDTLVLDFTTLYNLPNTDGTDFIDHEVAGIDLRILKDQERDVLMYGIINSDTVLISSDLSVFEQLSTLISSN